MFTIWGSRSSRFCDGISHRDFLKVGALGVGGLTLADLAWEAVTQHPLSEVKAAPKPE